MPKTAPTKPAKPKAPTKPRKKASPKAKASLQAQAPIVSEHVQEIFVDAPDLSSFKDRVEHKPIASNAPLRGRPSLYTEELADEIYELLAQGISLNKICKLPHMPSETTVRKWGTDSDHPFFVKYTRARELGYAKMGEELLEIADDSSLDHNDRRIKLDTRKWMLSKMLPKVYGDKLDIEAKVTVQTLTDDQINARLMQLAEATANAARSE